uniref:Uncharacterized protein n=1 Tax=Human betaherpesvirus 6 TaxID=10368 RepID=A0A5P9VIS9_9BETA|nr:hypothetical protein [Human betaherpesvirus 6]QFX63821.1 hypothetical protein [Human betaherpesvirus 6]
MLEFSFAWAGNTSTAVPTDLYFSEKNRNCGCRVSSFWSSRSPGQETPQPRYPLTFNFPRKTETAVALLADFRVLVRLGRKDPNRGTH